MKNITLHAQYQVTTTLLDPLTLFAQLTQQGSQVGCSFFEVNDPHSPYVNYSFGLCQASLSLEGKSPRFHYKAHSDLGRQLLTRLTSHLQQLDITEQNADNLCGRLEPDLKQTEFSARLSANNHRILLEQLLPTIITPKDMPNLPLGMFGCLAFDFIKQLEELPDVEDVLNDPDYCFYLPETLFIYDKTEKKLHLIVLQLAKEKINSFFQEALQAVTSEYFSQPYHTSELNNTASYQSYQDTFQKIQEEILAGNVFQLVYGCLFQGKFSGNALAAFQQLKKINPSDFAFYFHDSEGSLLGTSPESCIRIKQAQDKKIAELNPIAGSSPRGQSKDMDQRLRINLQLNQKELAEHTMLIDLARNDLCAISKPGSVDLVEAFNIKSYRNVQHLSSRVQGEMQPHLTPLQAYQATMNMGTLTGSPKPRALQLIAQYENQSRGYFGGAFGLITAQGLMETCIVIRSIRIKHNQVYLRAAGGIVQDSKVDAEWNEIHCKAKSCLDALKNSAASPLNSCKENK